MNWILKYLNELRIPYQILTLFTHLNGSLIDQVLIKTFIDKNSMYSSDIVVYISGHHVARVELKPN